MKRASADERHGRQRHGRTGPHGPRPDRGAARAGATTTGMRRSEACCADSAIQRSSSVRSRALCHRSSGSFARHVRDDAVERGRASSAAASTIARRVRVHDRARSGSPGSCPRTPASGQHLVEHRAEREDVGARIGLLALELLGRHVLQRAEDRALRGQIGGVVVGSIDETAAPRRLAPRLRQPEVEQLGARPSVSMMLPGLRSRWTMPGAVRLVERIGDLDRRSAAPGRAAARPSASRVGERLALEMLHHQEVDAVLAADVVERADVRVVQRGDRAGLALEAFADVGIAGERGREDLDGDRAIEARVAGP